MLVNDELIVMKGGGAVGVDGLIVRGIKASVRYRLASWVGLFLS